MDSDQVFHDAIHGSMNLPPLCVEIINTIQFQRLRNIKQLGLCYYVYPSVSHNRFEHCLGTCYLAGKMIRHLKQQNPELEISDRDILCVQIAGLCHDLGHGPFSHAFQDIINKHQKEKDIINEDREENDIINEDREEKDIINEDREKKDKWNHEDASHKMFDELLKKNEKIKNELKPDEIVFIKELITGEKVKCSQKNFFYQIINNKLYNNDVDKWDYLARDSHYLGFGTSFDHERMIKMSKVIGDKICYRDKTLDNFYDMFYSRYRLHKTVYKHKTVLLFNKLLGEAFESADAHLKIFKKVYDMREFTYLTDSILEEILKNEECECLKEARNKLKDIIERSYKYKGRVEDRKEQRKEQDDVVCKAEFDYGDGKNNPLVKIPFYEKGAEKADCYSLQELEAKLFLPSKFQMNFEHRFERK